MNRPRQSVLAQFDPLLAEDEPRYLSDSDEESDPDKENNAPQRNELTMTAFFKRTYKRDHAQPVVLRRRLVDVGDVTVADLSAEVAEADEEQVDLNDENEVEDSANVFSAETPKRPSVRPMPHTPRTPLAEIVLEHDPMPDLPRKKPFKRSSPIFTSHPEEANQAREISSLSSLVDAVNLAGTSFGQAKSTDPLSASAIRHSSNNSVLPPRIQVDDSEADAALPESILNTSAPFTDPPPTLSATKDSSDAPRSSLLVPRSAAPTTSSSDPSRLSLDLHASFQLQSETSFDLLNDRISFFDTQEKGMASFLNALDDDSFREEIVKQDNQSSVSSLSSADTTPEPVTRPSTPREPKHDTTPVQDPKTCRKFQPEERVSPVPSTVRSKHTVLPSERRSSLTASDASESLFAPFIAQSNALVTPAVSRTAVTTVPALRVIKRTKRYDDERLTSASSRTTDTHSTATSGDTRGSSNTFSAPLSKPTRPSSTLPAKISTPLISAVVRPGGPMRVLVTESSAPSVRGMPRPPIPKLGNPSTGNGPRRILLPEPATSLKPIAAQTLSANAMNTVKAKSVSQPVPRAIASRAAVSGVPRPVSTVPSVSVSRLPAPSGIARLGRKRATTSTGEARTGTDAPVRGLPRRVAQ